MRHNIIKFTETGEESIGELVINDDGSFYVDSLDSYLKNWIEELNGEEITISEGIKGMNEQGHPVYAEISKVVTPRDSDFIGALQRYLPEDYCLEDVLIDRNLDQHRKTA